jgi:hypothetical protein
MSAKLALVALAVLASAVTAALASAEVGSCQSQDLDAVPGRNAEGAAHLCAYAPEDVPDVALPFRIGATIQVPALLGEAPTLDLVLHMEGPCLVELVEATGNDAGDPAGAQLSKAWNVTMLAAPRQCTGHVTGTATSGGQVVYESSLPMTSTNAGPGEAGAGSQGWLITLAVLVVWIGFAVASRFLHNLVVRVLADFMLLSVLLLPVPPIVFLLVLAGQLAMVIFDLIRLIQNRPTMQ